MMDPDGRIYEAPDDEIPPADKARLEGYLRAKKEASERTIADAEAPEDIGWAIVELMGHRRLGGYVREQVVAGAAFLRIDVPQNPPATQLYSAGAVYCITPTTETMARAAAGRGQVEPVSRWELPAPPAEDPEDAELAYES
jgi:hypothetical protein